MTNKSPEVQTSSEIKTPEELATRLEKNSQQGLARRIRQIEGGVQGTAQDKLAKLQQELTPAEKIEIKTALANEEGFTNTVEKVIGSSDVERKGNDSKTSGESTQGESGDKENTSKFKKWREENKLQHGILEKAMMKAAKEEGGELGFGEKILIKTIAFIAPLIPVGLLGWLAEFDILPAGFMEGMKEWNGGDVKTKIEEKAKDVKEKAETKMEGVKEKNKEVEEKGKEKIKVVAYEGISSHLITRNNKKVFSSLRDAVGQGIKDSTWGKDEALAEETMIRKSKEILQSPIVNQKSFNQIKSYKGHSKDLGIQGTEKTQTAVDLVIMSLIDNEGWIDGHLTKLNANWRDLPLHESLLMLYKGIGYDKIDDIKNCVKNLNFSNPTESLAKISTLMYRKNPDGSDGGLVGENIASLRSEGLNEELLERCFISLDKEGQNDIKQYREETLINHPYINKDQDDKYLTQRFAEKVSEKNGFCTAMTENMKNFGLGDYTEVFNNGEGFTMRQALEMYIITKGEKNIDNMSMGTRYTLYLTLTSYIIERNPGEEAMKKLVSFLNTPDSKYLVEFKEIFATVFNRATYETLCLSIGIGKEVSIAVWEFIKENPGMAAGFMAVLVIVGFLAIRYSKFIVAVSVITGVLIAMTKVSLATLGGAKPSIVK